MTDHKESPQNCCDYHAGKIKPKEFEKKSCEHDFDNLCWEYKDVRYSKIAFPICTFCPKESSPNVDDQAAIIGANLNPPESFREVAKDLIEKLSGIDFKSKEQVISPWQQSERIVEDALKQAYEDGRKAENEACADLAEDCPHVGEPCCYCGNKIAQAIKERMRK